MPEATETVSCNFGVYFIHKLEVFTKETSRVHTGNVLVSEYIQIKKSKQ